MSQGMREVGDDRNLPVQQYPIELIRRAFHPPQHRQHSSRRRLGRRPGDFHVNTARSMHDTCRLVSGSKCGDDDKSLCLLPLGMFLLRRH